MTRHSSTLADRYKAHRDALVTRADARRMGTRKRGLSLVVVGLAGLATMFQLVGANVLAVNFTTTNSAFQLYTNYLQGEEVAGYLNTTSRQNGLNAPVAEIGIKHASLAGLCLIANETLPGPLGDYSVVLTAGDPVPATAGFQSGLAPTNPNYYLPTGWTSGTDVWAAGGDLSQGQYVGALKGARATNAVKASDLYLNTTSLRGAGYKVSGLYLGERAQDVGDSASVTWETGSGAPAPPATGGFGLHVSHLNLAGAQLWTDGSPAIPGTPAVPDQPATPDTTVVSSDGPPAITRVTSNWPETNVSTGESVGSILDGLLGTKWYTAHSAVNATYTLSQPYRVTSYYLYSGNDAPERDPYNFTLQGSSDNSTWTTVDTVTGNTFAARNTGYSFTVDNPGTYKYYKLDVTKTAGTSNNGGGTAFQITEWKLSDIGLTSSSASTNAGTGKEAYRFIADGDPATKWFTGSFASPTITYQMQSPMKMASYTMVSANDSGTYTGRNPKSWVVEGSNDNSTWTAVDSRSNVTWNSGAAGNFQVQTFDVTTPTSYLYYRLRITAVTSGTDLQLADWTFGTNTVTTVIPGTPFIPGTPAGPDTPAIPAGGSTFGVRLNGSISLPHLKLRLVPGKQTQSYCPTAAP